MLDALLILPPFSTPVFPAYPAPFFLADTLARDGFRARAVDLNRSAIRAFFAGPELRRLKGDIHNERRELEAMSALSPGQARRYHRLVRREASLRLLGQATGTTRDFARASDCVRSQGPLRRYFLCSRSESLASWPPATVGSLRAALHCDAAASLQRRLAPLVRDLLATLRPRLVGLSLPWVQTLVPALAVASLIRKMSPRTHVCLGGPLISLLPDQTTDACFDLGIVDSYVRQQGHEALLELTRATRDDQPIKPVARLFVRPGALDREADSRRRATGRQALVTDTSVEPRARHLPPAPDGCRLPSYEIRELRRALPAIPVAVPVFQSRGCYWGKCVFCDYVNVSCGGYRCRPPADVVEDMAYYARFGFDLFHLIAEAIPPRHLADLAQEILARDLHISYLNYLRVDPAFDEETLRLMRVSGWTPGNLGVESASDRALALLRKGYTRRDIETVFDNFRRVGLPAHVGIILDVPGTSYAEALEVYRFFESYQDILVGVGISMFELTSSAALGRDPSSVGLDLKPGKPRRAVLSANSMAFHDPLGMSSREKQHVLELYVRLCRKLAERRRTAFARSLSPSGLRVCFPPHPGVACRLHFSESGRRLHVPEKRWCLDDASVPAASTAGILVGRYRERTVAFTTVARSLGDVTDPYGHAKEAVLQLYHHGFVSLLTARDKAARSRVGIQAAEKTLDGEAP